jgi:precorrin-2 dehydrogenase/sirohydrochlorin ferrochelatase
MDAFPAFFPLAGRKIVIAGEGDPAEAKARLFEGGPASVVHLSAEEAVMTAAYAGALLAFIAGGEADFVAAAAAAARAAGVPVNVVDRPDLCDFITPAIVDRGEVVAAVSTTGAAPMLAALLRNDLEAAIPEGAGRVAALFRRLRDDIRAALPDLDRRRAFLRAALAGPVVERAGRGDLDGATRLIREALMEAGRTTHAGRITIVDGAGAADFLSLRASRALSLAEVLVADPGCSSGVLGLVRRDARHLPAETDAGQIVALAREGVQLVRLIARPLPPGTLETFASAGVVLERLHPAPAAP